VCEVWREIKAYMENEIHIYRLLIKRNLFEINNMLPVI